MVPVLLVAPASEREEDIAAISPLDSAFSFLFSALALAFSLFFSIISSMSILSICLLMKICCTMRTTAPTIQYRPMPLGREKQKTADMAGIMRFMVFMVCAVWSLGSEDAWGISLTLSHCVNAARKGMMSATTIMIPPRRIMLEGDSAMLSPRKLLYWFSFVVVVAILSPSEDSFPLRLVQSALWNLFRISMKLFLIASVLPASILAVSCLANWAALENRYLPSASWDRITSAAGSSS